MYQFHLYSNLEDRFIILHWVGGRRWQSFSFRIVIPRNEFIFLVCNSNISAYSAHSCNISYFHQHVTAEIFLLLPTWYTNFSFIYTNYIN